MKESLRNDIERATQAMVCAIMLDQLDRDEAVNFNSFTIDTRDEFGKSKPMAIVTVQRPGMMSPIEKYNAICEALRLIREVAIDDRGDPRADKIIAIADEALTSKPPAAS